MTSHPNGTQEPPRGPSGKLAAFGAILVGVATLAAGAMLLRQWFPDALPRLHLRSFRPPVQPWQGWVFVCGLFVIGLRMFVAGIRTERLDPPDPAAR